LEASVIQEPTEFAEPQADGFQKSRLFGFSCEIMLLGEFVPIIGVPGPLVGSFYHLTLHQISAALGSL